MKFLFFLSPAGGATVATLSATQDSSQLKELQATICSLQEEAKNQKITHEELMASLEEAGHLRMTLEREKEEAKAENTELLQNLSRLQSSVSELQTRVQEQEGKAMFKAQQDSEIQSLRKTLTGNCDVLYLICLGFMFCYSQYIIMIRQQVIHFSFFKFLSQSDIEYIYIHLNQFISLRTD